MSKNALLVIDVQKAFNEDQWGQRNNLSAEIHIKELIHLFRMTKNEVIYIKHRSGNPESLFHPDNKTSAFKPEAQPLENELILTKTVNSAFIETNLEKILQ